MKPGVSRLVLVLAAALSPSTAGAQPAKSPALPNAPTRDTLASAAARPLTAADLEPYLDGLVAVELSRYDIAGAVISVVKDGALLFSKGYGFADVAKKIPVSPESTLFRVASISKLFTGTAVMQLVEQGKLDLDADVDSYLDFKVPRRFPDKITLRQIMTHTAGFEESFKQLPADSGKSVPLREWATKMTPAQIYKPGTVTSYSNYAVDLAGYVVERVSGRPFAEYVRVHILDPLGMAHSSIAEPLPPALRRLVSEGYAVASDSALPFEVIQGEPSGNMSSTANDMAKFAVAHLQLGRFGDARILSEESARLMAKTQFRTQRDVPGMGLSFFEESRNGYRIVGHGGDLSRFHSHLSLLMDEGVAIFLSVNSAGNGGGLYDFREAVRNGFLDRYFPRRVPPEPVVPNAAEQARRVAGPYTLSRRGETSLGRLLMLAVPLDVEANSDGTIQIPFLTGANGRPVRWSAIGPLTFRNADGSQRIGFVADSSGDVVRMAFLGGHELERIAFVDTRPFNFVVAGVALAAFVGTLLLWPVAGVVRRRYGKTLPADGVGRRLRGLTRGVALANLIFVVALGLFVSLGFAGKIKLDSSTDPLLAAIRLIGLLGLLGAAAVILASIRTWTRGTSGWARFKYTLLAGACVSFAWFSVHWHMLSWNFKY